MLRRKNEVTNYDDKPVLDVVFAESRPWQRLSFPDISVHSGELMTSEVPEVYPRKKGRWRSDYGDCAARRALIRREY
jgi:hypothetical protein